MADEQPKKEEEETKKPQEDDDDEEGEKGNKITVTVKTPKEKESFEVNDKMSIKDFKEQVAPKFKAEPDQLVMIYAGKIMKDNDTLETHHVKEGFTIHLVINGTGKKGCLRGNLVPLAWWTKMG